jgi:hypothetical protein
MPYSEILDQVRKALEFHRIRLSNPPSGRGVLLMLIKSAVCRALAGTDLQRRLSLGTPFRLTALKFRSGILNSCRPVPIAPQPCASSQKTGEIGSQSQSSR